MQVLSFIPFFRFKGCEIRLCVVYMSPIFVAFGLIVSQVEVLQETLGTVEVNMVHNLVDPYCVAMATKTKVVGAELNLWTFLFQTYAVGVTLIQTKEACAVSCLQCVWR